MGRRGSQLRRWLFRLTLGLAVAALLLGVAEVALRRKIPGGLGRSQDFRVPHPVLGWKGEPGGSFAYPIASGETVTVHYNSLGLRDREHDIAKPAGIRRIVVLGDSFMEGYSVALEDAFPYQLERRMRDDGERVEVINLGVGGYGTLQELLIFGEHGRAFAPDLVLLGFFFENDLSDNSLALQNTKDWNHFLKHSARPFLDPAEISEWRIITPDYEEALRLFRRNRDSIGARLLRGSVLLQTLKWAATTFQAPHPERLRRLEDERVALASHGQHYCVEPPEFTEAWRITRAILARLREATRAVGASLVVFSIPGISAVEPRYRDAFLSALPDARRSCIGSSPPPAYARLAGVLAELGIRYVDLLPAFREAAGAEPEQSLFYVPERLWNARGYALAAQGVARALHESGGAAAHPR